MTMTWLVQVGRGSKGSYTTKYHLKDKAAAFIWYSGINIHSGYKKRLVDPDGKVILRHITH